VDIAAPKVEVERRPKVLCATDLWPRSKVAVGRAHAIARAIGGQLLLLHVLNAAGSRRTVRRRSARARFSLDAQAHKLARWGGKAQIAVRTGSPHETIADVAIEWDVDLIVLGPYRRRFGDGLRGATAERVIRKADRPVLVVNRPASGPYEHVLLTSDLSKMSGDIAAAVKELGLLEGARTSVVHALQHTSAILCLAGVSESKVNQYRRSLRKLAAEEIKTHLARAGVNSAGISVFSLERSPLRGIEQVAKRMGSGLVVIGSSRFPLLKRVFLGSVSNEILRGIKHDVLLISPAAVQRIRRLVLAGGACVTQSQGTWEPADLREFSVPDGS
jgi:nucleotide-binding universal stress UspA family protein